jgi:hypothetical protein
MRAPARSSLKHASLGWRTHDRAGQRLGEEFIRIYPEGKRFWHFQGQRLQRPGEAAKARNCPRMRCGWSPLSGTVAAARSVLREWHSTLKKQMPANRAGFDYRQHIPAMDLMARLELSDELRALLKALKESPQWKADNFVRQKLEEFENRLAFLAGNGRARIAVWAVPPAAKDEPTAICWEIGAAFMASRDPSRSRSLTLAAEEFSVLNGRYDVEIFHGPTPSSMRKLATIPATKARGSWTSPTSLGAGYVLAVARDKSNALFSAPSSVITGQNLLTNPQLIPDEAAGAKKTGTSRTPVPGWRGIGADGVVVRSGGPRPGGHYANLLPRPQSGGEAAATQRLRIEPGKEYLFAGWLRFASNSGSARLTGHFYDKDGKRLGQFELDSGEGDRWLYAQRRLVRARGANGSEQVQVIPETAVEVELMIQASSGCAVDGLYFGESLPTSSQTPGN